jgi:hypothetical protein
VLSINDSVQPLSKFDDDPAVIYALDSRLCLVYHNAAWNRFAIENGAPDLADDTLIGRDALELVALPLQRFYLQGFARVLRELRPWEHVYECSDPGKYRKFHMQVLPLERSALLVVNSLVAEADILPEKHAALEEYAGSGGIVTMCCHCRRTLRAAKAKSVWDWVPEFVAQMPARCSHGLCPTCLAYHYPAMDVRELGR